jgi:hypothetical protein
MVTSQNVNGFLKKKNKKKKTKQKKTKKKAHLL